MEGGWRKVGGGGGVRSCSKLTGIPKCISRRSILRLQPKKRPTLKRAPPPEKASSTAPSKRADAPAVDSRSLQKKSINKYTREE